jgi:hypothetical protein
MKPDFRVLVFMGSGRDAKGLGGNDLRISDTRGTTFFAEGDFLVILPTTGEVGLLGRVAPIGEAGFVVGWEIPNCFSRGGDRLETEDGAETMFEERSPPAASAESRLWLLDGRRF